MSQRRPLPPRQPGGANPRGGIGAQRPARREGFLQRRRSQERAEAQTLQASSSVQRAPPRRRVRTTTSQKVMLVITTILGVLLAVSFVLPYLNPGP